MRNALMHQYCLVCLPYWSPFSWKMISNYWFLFNKSVVKKNQSNFFSECVFVIKQSMQRLVHPPNYAHAWYQELWPNTDLEIKILAAPPRWGLPLKGANLWFFQFFFDGCSNLTIIVYDNHRWVSTLCTCKDLAFQPYYEYF